MARLNPAFADATSVVWVFLSFMNSLFWQSVTWRPGTPALSFDSGKHKRGSTGHRRQEASGDFFAGLELQSGYALPPFQAGDPRLTLIVAG